MSEFTRAPFDSFVSASTGSSGGVLVAHDGRPLLLKSLRVAADARGGLARVIVEQRFANPYDQPLHLTYALPLPAEAAVTGFAFLIGGRRVVGEIDRRAAARERFEQALVMGKSTAILDQERSSLFTQEIGNVPPRTEVVAEIVIDQRLAWNDEGAWEWRFPTTVAPRYLAEPGRVPDAARVAQHVVAPGAGQSEARLAFTLAVRDALATGRVPESPSHRIVARDLRGAFDVALAEGDHTAGGLDRDVVVRWRVARPAVGVTIDLGRPIAGAPHADAAYGLLTIVPPSPEVEIPRVPRDLIVLIDTSGSMEGRPLEDARRVAGALVGSLGDDDSIELVEFSTSASRFQPDALLATKEVRAAALRWLASLRASGGTEMRDGILEAMRTLRDGVQRQVVVVSDGLIGFESQVIGAILARLPPSARLHTVGVGSAVNRSLTQPAARAGRGVEVLVGHGEDAERAAARILARTAAPLVVDLKLEGSALVEHAPALLPDLFERAPARFALKLRPEGGEVVLRGRSAQGAWEHRVRVPGVGAGEGCGAVVTAFGRELAADLEMQHGAGPALNVNGAATAALERIGLAFQISTRATSWIAVADDVTIDPRGGSRRERVPHELPYGMSMRELGLRPAAATGAFAVSVHRAALGSPGASGPLGTSPPASVPPSSRFPRLAGAEFDDEVSLTGGEKTRVTSVGKRPVPKEEGEGGCLVVIYTKEPALLGRRFVLNTETKVGRGAENDIVLDGDSVSRRHARFEQRTGSWFAVDNQSTNGTYVNDTRITADRQLANGDRIKIGPTIFKYLIGDDVEAQYHEEVYRMTIIDGLTGAHVKRYLLEHLEKEIIRARRHQRDLSLIMFDLDHFKKVNDEYGHLAGDHVLKEVSRLVLGRLRQGDVLARYGGEEFAIVLPETPADRARGVGDDVRKTVERSRFEFQADVIPVTISLGVAQLESNDKNLLELIKRADEKLYEAKRSGRNKVVA